MRRSSRVAAILGFAVMLVSQRAVQAEPITTMPEDAILMVKFNNLQQVSKKVGKLCEQWGFAAMLPQSADPLAFLKEQAHISKGLDPAGEMALLVLQREMPHGRPLVLMIPVTDYQAFLSNFPNATSDAPVAAADKAITNITLAGQGEPAFVAKWGSYAALALDKSLLEEEDRSQFKPLPQVTAKQMNGRDVVMYLNFNSFREQAVGGLQLIRSVAVAQMMQQMRAQIPAEKQKMLPAFGAAMGQVFTGMEHLMKDTRTTAWGIALADDGIQVTTICEFEPDSYLGQLAGKVKNVEGNLACGLPQGNYIMVGGLAVDSPVYSQMIQDAAAPVVAALSKAGPEAQPVNDVLGAMKKLADSTKRYTFAVAPGEQAGAGGPLVREHGVIEGDAAAVRAAQRTAAAAGDKLANAMNLQKQGVTTTVLKQDARTVGGVKFDELTVTLSGVSEGSPEAVMQKIFYGDSGIHSCIGQINPQTVLVIQASDNAVLQKGIDAARNRSTTFMDGPFKQVAAKLPARRAMEGYLAVDQLVLTISKGAQMVTGQPLPLEIPAGQPPIAVSVSTEGPSLRSDLYIPSSVVQSMVGAIMQMQMGQMLNEKKQDGGL